MRCSQPAVCDAKTNTCKKEIDVDIYVDNNFKDKLPAENLELQYLVTNRVPERYKGASLSVVKLK